MNAPIDLIILAGGAGSRMGGLDKGLIDLDGRPAVQHLLDRFLADGDQLIVSANRHHARYRGLGARVIADPVPGQGPLAGLLAALDGCQHDWQLVLPCDMPWLPAALKEALLASARPDGVSVLHDGSRMQSLCLSFSASQQRESLSAYLASGQRSAHGWLSEVSARPCHVNADQDRAFINLNTPGDLPA